MDPMEYLNSLTDSILEMKKEKEEKEEEIKSLRIQLQNKDEQNYQVLWDLKSQLIYKHLQIENQKNAMEILQLKATENQHSEGTIKNLESALTELLKQNNAFGHKISLIEEEQKTLKRKVELQSVIQGIKGAEHIRLGNLLKDAEEQLQRKTSKIREEFQQKPISLQVQELKDKFNQTKEQNEVKIKELLEENEALKMEMKEKEEPAYDMKEMVSEFQEQMDKKEKELKQMKVNFGKMKEHFNSQVFGEMMNEVQEEEELLQNLKRTITAWWEAELVKKNSRLNMKKAGIKDYPKNQDSQMRQIEEQTGKVKAGQEEMLKGSDLFKALIGILLLAFVIIKLSTLNWVITT